MTKRKYLKIVYIEIDIFLQNFVKIADESGVKCRIVNVNIYFKGIRFSVHVCIYNSIYLRQFKRRKVLSLSSDEDNERQKKGKLKG